MNTQESAPASFPTSKAFSIEPHGDGFAIYQGRDMFHHGLNLGHLTETDVATTQMLEGVLNAGVEHMRNREHAGKAGASDAPNLADVAWKETVRLARVALQEMPAHDATDWQAAARRVCQSVVAMSNQPPTR
jgi:hypothetical protein